MPPLPPHVDEKEIGRCLGELKPGFYNIEITDWNRVWAAREGAKVFAWQDKVYVIWPNKE